MKLKIRRIEPTRRSRRTLKDWFDLVLPAATLVLGVVSLWTTIQVSGLEDYFRSEVARRNQEVSTLESRYQRAEEKLAGREIRLEQLSLDADRLGALNDEQRLILSKIMIDLSEARLDSEGAKLALSDAIRYRAQVESDRDEQLISLEILYREELYSLVSSRPFSLRVNSLAGIDRLTPGLRNLASEFRQSLMTLNINDTKLTPYLQELKNRFDQICPAFGSTSIVLPHPPAEAEYSAPPFRRIHTSSDREEFMTIWRLENERRYKEWKENQLQYNEEVNRKWDFVTSQFESCVCSALATDDVRPSMICPAD